MKERLFNYRPLLVVFLSLLVGSLFAFYIKENLIASLIAIGISLSVLILLAIKSKKIKYILLPVFCIVIGALGYYIAIYNFSSADDKNPEYITARIASIEKNYDGAIQVVCDDCVFDDEKVSSNILLTITCDNSQKENLTVGKVIYFAPTKVSKYDLMYYDLPDASAYSQDIKYKVSTGADYLTITGEDFTVGDKIKNKIGNNISNNMSNENSNLVLSTIFGDRSNLDEDLNEAYKNGGVAHLLAISGLHVSIIVLALSKVLDKFKIKRWWKLSIIGVILFGYAYLCDFYVSIVRAIIIALALILSEATYEQYDSVSALSLAGIIIFLINPLSVFDVSFLLSFTCVFGIIFFTKPISKVLHKGNLPNFLATPLAISLSTSIAVLFVMAYFFNELSLISWFANIIIIPIFTVLFSGYFFVAFLSLVWSGFAILLLPFDYALLGMNYLIKIFANLIFSTITTNSIPFISIFLYFVLLLMLSSICTAKQKNKILISLPIVILIIVAVLV